MTSKEHEYRYFNFAFACVLYNVWRLVDLLVKLALEDDPGVLAASPSHDVPDARRQGNRIQSSQLTGCYSPCSLGA